MGTLQGLGERLLGLLAIKGLQRQLTNVPVGISQSPHDQGLIPGRVFLDQSLDRPVAARYLPLAGETQMGRFILVKKRLHLRRLHLANSGAM